MRGLVAALALTVPPDRAAIVTLVSMSFQPAIEPAPWTVDRLAPATDCHNAPTPPCDRERETPEICGKANAAHLPFHAAVAFDPLHFAVSLSNRPMPRVPRNCGLAEALA